jgi:large subunit ribosomal protein L13
MAVDKTFVPKGKVDADWILIDAAGQGIGRLATQIAGYLLGKHKPIFTPGVEMGDAVVVINASQLRITGKRLDEKNYYHHSNYPGGLRTTNLRDQMKNHPDRVIRAAVWGMLPHNKLGRQLIKNLKIFSGPVHKHEAQNPKVIEGA